MFPGNTASTSPRTAPPSAREDGDFLLSIQESRKFLPRSFSGTAPCRPGEFGASTEPADQDLSHQKWEQCDSCGFPESSRLFLLAIFLMTPTSLTLQLDVNFCSHNGRSPERSLTAAGFTALPLAPSVDLVLHISPISRRTVGHMQIKIGKSGLDSHFLATIMDRGFHRTARIWTTVPVADRENRYWGDQLTSGQLVKIPESSLQDSDLLENRKPKR